MITSTAEYIVTFLLLLFGLNSVEGFIIQRPQPQVDSCRSQRFRCPALLLAGRRYGPPLDDLGRNQGGSDQSNIMERQKAEFQELVDQVLSASKPEHVPSLLAKNTKFLLSLKGEIAVEIIESSLSEAHEKGGEEEASRVAEAVDMILSFTEEFVNQSKDRDDYNKELLGRIIRTMADKEGSEREREEKLDELILNEKENFSRGFLRHLDGECDRIASAPKLTPESARLKETLSIIKTRILEELGKDLGEGALVLGQLIAYDDKNERMAVLDAGLTVRGVEFAQELASLTEEALEGFEAVPNGVDPTLLSRVEEIDQRVHAYIDEHGEFL